MNYTMRFLVFSSGIATAVILLGFATAAFAAWVEPTASPPNNNAPTPINIGSVKQQKAGGLYVANLLEANSFALYGNGILSGGSRYLNFGTNTGEGGYGFRDNNGTMQFKNSGGSWTNFNGSAATSTGSSSITIPTCSSSQVLTGSGGKLSCITMPDASPEGTWCGLATMGAYPQYLDRYYSSPQSDPRNFTSVVSCKGTSIASSCPSGYTERIMCDAYGMNNDTGQASNTSCFKTCIKGVVPVNPAAQWLQGLEKGQTQVTPELQEWLKQFSK